MALDIAKMPGGPGSPSAGPSIAQPAKMQNMAAGPKPLDVTKTATFQATPQAQQIGNVGGARKLMSLYQNAGLTKQGAAALVGNQSVESAGLHPNLWQFGSSPSQHVLGQGTTGYGLAQWTDAGRQSGLKQYAASHNEKVGTVAAQGGYTLQELGSQPGLLNALKTGHNTASLTTAVQDQYERPASDTASIGERISRAQDAANTNWGLNSGGKASPAPGISNAGAGRGSHLVTTYKEEPTEVPTTAADRAQYSQNVARNVVAQYGATDFTANFVRSMTNNPPPQMKAAQVRIGTTSRVPNAQQATTLAQAASAAQQGKAGTNDPLWQTVMKSANYINSKQMNYEWGGGHNASFAPTHGSGHGSGSGVGYDCSGVLSRVLHTAGLLNQPLVSGQMADLGRYVKGAQKGPAPANDPHAITIYANSVHTFAKIGNQYFGTSDQYNPGGGAGWIGGQKAGDTELNYLSSLGGYQTWHINL